MDTHDTSDMNDMSNTNGMKGTHDTHDTPLVGAEIKLIILSTTAKSHFVEIFAWAHQVGGPVTTTRDG